MSWLGLIISIKHPEAWIKELVEPDSVLKPDLSTAPVLKTLLHVYFKAILLGHTSINIPSYNSF